MNRSRKVVGTAQSCKSISGSKTIRKMAVRSARKNITDRSTGIYFKIAPLVRCPKRKATATSNVTPIQQSPERADLDLLLYRERRSRRGNWQRGNYLLSKIPIDWR